LPRFGWKPFILTTPTNARSESEAPVLEAPYEDLTVKYKSRETVNYHGIPSEIDKFSHIEMAKKFSAILDELV
jgi:hypothetical protein